MFSGIYYYVDNCDSANFPCSLVDYQTFLSKDKPDLSKDKPECLSFSSIRPQVADGANPCISHRNATEFSFEKFLPYFYFSMVTTTTVGYGDITPISNSAVWIVIFHHLTSIILLVGVVAQLTDLQATECECAEDE
jgi:Ion channel